MFLVEHIEHVRLVLGRIDGAQEPVPLRAMFDAGVVAGRDIVRFQGRQAIHQRPVLDVFVAADAGVRSSPGGILADEVVDHRGLEFLFEVHHVVANAQLPRHPACVANILDRAALLVPLELVRASFRPQPHGHADDLVALLMQQRSRHGAIDSAGHANDDPGSVSHPLVQSFPQL